ncbi:hypothetical protein MMC24_005663 [Lignoscripta atroalba]|nr:hypothetical protein [Lignoscripta atroalba]
MTLLSGSRLPILRLQKVVYYEIWVSMGHGPLRNVMAFLASLLPPYWNLDDAFLPHGAQTAHSIVTAKAVTARSAFQRTSDDKVGGREG